MALELKVAGTMPAEVNISQLQAAVRAVNKQLGSGSPNGNINLKLVDDNEIQALNKKYAASDHATDVLSWSYIEGGQQPIDGELGDVAISLDTAGRQSRAAGTDLGTELCLLLVHGVLHIAGFDHATIADQQHLDELQAAIMHNLNLTYRNFQWDSSKA